MQHALPIIVVNGVIDAQVSPLDRGFAYGDGVFETCRMINKKIPLWNFHKERLLNSCKKLLISTDEDLIESQLNNIMAILNESDANAIVKITVTRGEGGRGYNISGVASPTIVIGIFPASHYPESNFLNGITVRICNQRLSCNPNLAGIKHLNRLEQILARAEWNDETIAEAIVFDVNNHLIEAVFSNLFLVKGSELFTPDLSEAGVSGVMRRVILEKIAPELGIKTQVARYGLQDLMSADEVFLCNSNYGIWPVRKILAEQSKEFNSTEIAYKLQAYLHKTFFA